jgi:alanine dehydrogenase
LWDSIKNNAELSSGMQTYSGKIVNEEIGTSLNLKWQKFSI